MERIEVKSSSIRTIGYDAKEQVLEVQFTSMATYRYSGVPKEIADAFLNAESKGTFFGVKIRACFPYERLHAEGCGSRLNCTVVNCPCWCHKQRKDVTDAKPPNENLEKELRKSIKAVKAKKRTAI